MQVHGCTLKESGWWWNGEGEGKGARRPLLIEEGQKLYIYSTLYSSITKLFVWCILDIIYHTGVLGGGGLGGACPQIKLNHDLFSIPYKWLWYSTCRQVEISFLGMPQIAHFQVEKWKSSLPWQGETPLPNPPPARSLRSLGLGRFASSQRLRPPNVLPHYATFYHTNVSTFNL